MGLFLTWNEYRLREDNARKRAVKAALNGLGPKLPGSYAACPSTNVRAMKAAKKRGVVSEEERMPDYSFDRWVQKAQEFGDDVNKMRSKAEDDEEDIDKKIDDSKKKAEKADKEQQTKAKSEPKQDVKEDDPDTKKRKEEVWKLLRKKHQESLPKDDKSARS